jgi:hypothetical protein
MWNCPDGEIRRGVRFPSRSGYVNSVHVSPGPIITTLHINAMMNCFDQRFLREKNMMWKLTASVV